MKGKKAAIAGTAVLALAAGGVGVAQAVGGGDSDQNATGPDAGRAKAAGVQAAGGGKAVQVERSDERASGWEVKVDKGGGKLVEVQLDGSFHKVSVATDDDSQGSRGDGDGETNDDG